MSPENLMALLRLQCIPGVGSIRAKKLISYCGSPSAVFSQGPHFLENIQGISLHMAREILSQAYLKIAAKEYDYIVKNNIEHCSFLDSSYPQNLLNCVDGPLLLFQKGRINLEKKRIISVVGTRNSTRYGLEFCNSLMKAIQPYNPVIVSGFAYGIDILAQKAAINNGLQTVACLAHGLNQIYPREHLEYVKAVQDHGGFYSEFWSSSSPERMNFLQRNRIIAGISDATVVIESSSKGGSLVTADIAHSYNREVFAVPGRTTDRFSEGCNNLIKTQKAQMIVSGDDLAEQLGWNRDIQHLTTQQKRLFTDLEMEEELLFNYMSKQGTKSVDQISVDCGLTVNRTLNLLFGMELKGLIQGLPGKMYQIR